MEIRMAMVIEAGVETGKFIDEIISNDGETIIRTEKYGIGSVVYALTKLTCDRLAEYKTVSSIEGILFYKDTMLPRNGNWVSDTRDEEPFCDRLHDYMVTDFAENDTLGLSLEPESYCTAKALTQAVKELHKFKSFHPDNTKTVLVFAAPSDRIFDGQTPADYGFDESELPDLTVFFLNENVLTSLTNAPAMLSAFNRLRRPARIFGSRALLDDVRGFSAYTVEDALSLSIDEKRGAAYSFFGWLTDLSRDGDGK